MTEELMQIVENVDTLIPLVFLAYIVFSALVGLIRGWRKALIRLLTLAVAAVGAYPITQIVVSKVGDTLEPMVAEAVINKLNAADFSGEISTLAQYLGDISSALISVTFYTLSFLVLSAVLMVAHWILSAIFVRKSKKEGFTRLAGIVVGAACGLLCCVCVLMPVSGMLTTVNQVATNLTEEDRASLADIDPAIVDVVDQAEEISLYKDTLPLELVSKLGGEMLYNKLTAFKTPSGADSSLQHELDAIVHLVPAGIELAGQFGQEKSEETGMIHFDLQEAKLLLVPNLSRSEYLCGIIAEVCHTAGGKWNNNEEFLGMNLREMAAENNAFSVVVDHFLATLMATTAENLPTSIATICDDMTLLSHTANYVAMFSESEKTKDDLETQMDKVVLSVTENNIDFFNDMLTSEVMREGKLSEENAEVLSTIMADIFGEVAKLETEEERLTESAAINSLFTYAGQVGDENKEIDEGQLVDTVVASEAVSNVLQETIASGDYTVVELSYEKQGMLADILAEKSADATEEEQATLDAIAALFGLTV